MNTKNGVVIKMRNLIEVLRKHNHLYYVMGVSEIHDDEYDKLRLALIELEDTHPEYIQADSPILTVGGKPESTYETRKHTVPMLSLGNVFDVEELTTFINEMPIYSEPPTGMSRFILEHKFDGLAVSIVYNEGQLTQALTRGDGKSGEDVTNKVMQISNIPTYIDALKTTPVFEVRGEVLMTKAGFNKYNEEAIKNNEKTLSNARNAAAGSLRQKSNDKPRPLAFYAYSINQGRPKHITTQGEAFNWLSDNGFSIGHVAFTSTVSGIQQYYESVIEERDGLPYDIDGLVIKVDSLIDQLQMGSKTREPRWAIAYKFPAQHMITRLSAVTWQVGRMGQLTPVGHVDMVNVGGVNITNVTLHNYAEIQRLDIMIGDTVTLHRAGDVIPKITRTWPDLRPIDAQPILIPSRCPSCDSPIEPIEGDTMVFCMAGLECPSQRLGSISHFTSRECIDIDGLAQGTLAKLIDSGLVKDITDLYKLKDNKEAWMLIEGFGEKSFNKTIDSIEASKKTTLQRFIYGLAIRNVGEGTSIRLSKHFGNLDAFLNTTQEVFESIVDIGPITAAQIHQFIIRESNLKIIEELLEAGIDIKMDEPVSSNTGTEETVCITGTFDEPRTDLKKRLKAKGITVTSGISKKTGALLVGDKPSSSKVNKAKELNIPIITNI